nr:hypothetical protein Q903MT_gene5336 [Picea sitchensis]
MILLISPSRAPPTLIPPTLSFPVKAQFLGGTSSAYKSTHSILSFPHFDLDLDLARSILQPIRSVASPRKQIWGGRDIE